jgi:hypothetical protein
MQTVIETIKTQQPELSDNMARAFALLAMVAFEKKLEAIPQNNNRVEKNK